MAVQTSRKAAHLKPHVVDDKLQDISSLHNRKPDHDRLFRRGHRMMTVLGHPCLIDS